MFKPFAIIALAFCICSSVAEDCEEYIYGSSGSIVSPGYPVIPYENNLDCYYHIIAPEETSVTLEIIDMTLENGPDYLKIYDGPTNDSAVIGYFYGAHTNVYINASNNEVLIYFHTDVSIVYSGFNIYYSAVEIIKPQCPPDTYNADSGELLSPEYPNAYPGNADCYYNITTTYSWSLVLHVNYIDVEPGEHCDADFVEIYDVIDTNNLTSLAKLCGTGPINDIISESNSVVVYFHSNGQGQNNGFNITYSTDACEGPHEFSGDSGTFSSPGYPLANYPNYASCDYTITTPLYSEVYLHVNFMELESPTTSTCPYDYVKVYDGPNTSDDILARWCGTGPFEDIKASTNEILVHFNSDGSGSYSGFSITYAAVYPDEAN